MARRVLLSELRLGTISASLYCLEARLCEFGVNGIIGLDVLRHQTCLKNSKIGEVLNDNKLTIDFTSRTIRFGRSEHLEYSVPMENDPRQIIVAANILGHPLHLAVDTGAGLTTLFSGPHSIWIDRLLPFVQFRELPTLDGDCRAREVLLPYIELGDCSWGWVAGLVIDTRMQPTDGLLSVHTLRLKILHFDFDNHIMSWNR